MDPRLAALFTRQRGRGFADLRGAQADITLPVSDRLLNEIVAGTLPPSAPIHSLELTSRAGNRIAVRFKLRAAAFLPPVSFTLAIERQPELPASPILVLKLQMGGLLSLAGSAMRFLDALPPGVRVENDRILLNLPTLLAERGLADLLQYAEQVHVTTIEGAVVVAVRAAVRGSDT